jgi:cytochrome c-type biogenesis protein CcmE
MSKGAQLAIGATVIALLLGWYAVSNLGDGLTFQYYQTLAEFRAAGDAVRGRSLRVHGYVSTASIVRDVDARQVRFRIQNDPPHATAAAPHALDVVYRSLETPDLFQDGAEVVVEGRLEGGDGDAVFLADNVLAKCPSKFQAEAGPEEPRTAGL